MTATRVFVPITKSEKLDDGSRLVYGKMTGPDLDLDGQRCDPEWLKTAVPDWFKVGNIREMHQAWAVGKALDLEQIDDDYYITAKIVDAEACKKLDNDIYTGFSIGIRSPKIRKDASAPNGLIFGGKIIENSLADVPCNETCKLVLTKIVDGKEVLTKSDAVADPTSTEVIAGSVDGADAAGEGVAGNNAADLAEDAAEEAVEVDLLAAARAALIALLVGEVSELAEGEGGLGPVKILTYVISELDWFAECDAYDDAAARVESLNAARTPEDLMNLTALATLTKAATAEDATDIDKAAVADLRKALGIDAIKEEISTALTKAATAEDLVKVAVRLAKVEDTVVESGPTRIPKAADANKAAAADVRLNKIAEYRKLAVDIVDRDLAAAYTRFADELELAVA